jgi:hypothetical protein
LIEALGSIARFGLLVESIHVKSSDFTAVRDFKPSLPILKMVLYIFRVYEGSTDTEIFESFIEELLLYCGRWPAPKSVLIMDNASFHHLEKIQ